MSTADILEELPLLTPAQRAEVRAKLDTLDDAAPVEPAVSSSILNEPAIGMWRDRTDLPADPVEAVKELRRQMTRSRQTWRDDA